MSGGTNANSLMQQKLAQLYNDGLMYPSYPKQKDTLNDSFDKNGASSRIDELPSFKGGANSFVCKIIIRTREKVS